MPEFYNILLPHLTPHFLIILFIIILLYLTRRFHLRFTTEASYLPVLNFARQKRQKRDRIIDSQLASLSNLPKEPTQKLILNSTVTELTHLLNQGTITSEQILNTYFYRAATIGRKLELITESNYTEALYLAQQCDTVRQQTKPEDRSKLGGLYGIPMSIKDSFFQKGFDTTCGCAVVCFRPSPKDGEIVAFLKSRGAIPFIRSSTTQALQVYDCQNNIWGLACNPWDITRTVAGSSGGEAGLVAARCSPIGIGSDMRGSLTIPAAFCGLYGIKPTTGRCLAKGHVTFSGYSVSKFNALNLSSGPIGRSVDDLALFIKELMVEENRKQNVLVPYVPWNEEKFATTRKFRVGYSLTEEFFGASKACQRAIKEAVQALKASGHEVEEIKIPNFERMAVLMMVVMTSEGKGKGLVKSMGGDKPIKGVEEEIAIRALPTYVKKGMRILLQVLGYKRLAGLLSMVEEMTPDEYHERMGEYYNAKEELLKFISSNKFDAVITPTAPTPAFKQGHGVEFFIASCYAWPANIANLPSGIVPVTTVREDEEVYKKEDCVHEDFMSKACRDSVKQSKGMPVAVQVMSLPWEDETCLAVMKAIESKIKFRELPPLDF